MKKLTFAVGSAWTALLAFTIVCIDQILKSHMPIGSENGFTYIAFVSWAVYFFSGCTLKDGIRATLGYVIGIGFSIGIILIANAFAGLTTFFCVPIAVFIVVFLVLYLEKLPWINLIPAMFVASGCYFGIMNYVPDAGIGTAATVELIYGFIGLLFGWITIAGKDVLAKLIEK
ncbi:MAG: DUF1097 domain-containing protein [Dysgonamonadaceae bacterium]|jgi:hypothetical protein|nr:DUF1097 domain-containing protein [Dysgonamonadaceae bacterium]